MRYSIDILPEDYFGWIEWKNFNLLNEFNIVCQKDVLIHNKVIFQKYAVGYIEAEKLRCRPKKNCMAVMFLKDDMFSWFHMRDNEFYTIFGEENVP